VHRIATDIEKNEIDGIAPYLNDNVTAPWAVGPITIPLAPTREAVIDAGKATLRNYPVKKVTFINLKIDTSGRQARMHATTRIEFAGGEYKGMSGPVTWNLHWIKPKTDWVVDEVDYSQGAEP